MRANKLYISITNSLKNQNETKENCSSTLLKLSIWLWGFLFSTGSIWEVMNFLWITKITQTFMSHGWICNMLILHRLKEIAIQNKEWINLGNDELMHMKEETY